MRLFLLCCIGLLLPRSPQAQRQLALMPMPAELTTLDGQLRLDSTFTGRITGYSDARLAAALTRMLARLGRRIAEPVSTTPVAEGRLAVRVSGPGEAIQTPDEDESYHLEVSPGGATLTASTTVGALRGLETLLQLVSADSGGFYLPAVRIDDRPRFRWRGLLIDAARHFMPPAMIRRTLDGMAAVKLNVLHWHLADDQGFRVESRRYPELEAKGSDGQFYTQEEIRDIVRYARDRGIRVVPEFDMPGHATSWFTAYPQYASAPGPYQIERRFGVFAPSFDPTRQETYDFIDGFIGEMATLFPDPYWHIGGDEVMARFWDENPRILRFKREHRVPDDAALQAYFNQRLSRILSRHHKQMIGWDEVLHDSLPRTTVIQSWRGTEYLGRAAALGFQGILSAPYYLDHISPADEHYLADPIPPEANLTPAQQAMVLGGEACMWAEHVDAETVDSRIWPRLAAIAERFWSPASVRDVDDMYRRLSEVSLELERLGLRHETHTARMLRRLTGRRDVPALEELIAVTMPVTFDQRSRLQQPTQLTPLTRLVDAARPDPWARSTMNRLAALATHDDGSAGSARAELERSFAMWRPVGAAVSGIADTLPLARDGIPAARALGRLADIGLDALQRLGATGAPPDWKARALVALDSLAQPQGLLRLAGIDAVRTLIAAVPEMANGR